MTPRKVGQDMVVRKKPVKKTEVFVAAPKLNSNFVTKKQHVVPEKTIVRQEVKIIKKPVVNRIEEDEPSVKGFRSKNVQVFSSGRPPAKGGILWLFSGIAVIALIVTIFSLITRATITIDAKKTVYPINQQVTLYSEPLEGQVNVKTARIVDAQSITVPATSKQAVSTVATGKVRLFSTSTKSVTIPLGTQVTSSQKKIFVTKSKVVIPPGTAQKPGSSEVMISAIEPGAEYNIALDDLKITGFPAVIARTITSISGGASGDEFILTEAELTTAKATLQARIQASKPAAFLANQIPENFILPESMIQVSDISYKTESVQSGVSVTAERTIVGNMIEKEKLKQFFINTIIPEADRGFMQITDIKDVNFELPITSNNLGSNQPQSENIALPVYMKGTFTAQAHVDESFIRSKIAHQKKADARSIILGIPGITNTTINIRPLWIGRIPSKISAITFNINYKLQNLQ